jgi:hypothetical protein
LKDVQDFFDQHFKGKNYNYLLIGDKNKLNITELKKVGQFQELSLEEIFKY